MSANDPEQTLKLLRSPSGRTKLWCQAAFKAFSIHPIKWSSRSGLFRTNCSGLHGSCPHAIITIASHENNGYAVTSGDKAVLQVNAAQSRNLHIGDKARCVVNLLRFEKFIGRAKCGSVVVQRLNELHHAVSCKQRFPGSLRIAPELAGYRVCASTLQRAFES
jgi:hypothetical protein